MISFYTFHFILCAALLIPTLGHTGGYYNAKTVSAEIAMEESTLQELVTPEKETPPAELSLVENVSKNETLATLAKALQAADLSNVLKGNGPFTLLAPTDFAFNQLPPGTLQNLLKPENKGQLAKILTYHIIPGRKSLATLKTGKLKTLNGKELDVKVEKNHVSINGVTLSQPEIVGMNGTIIIIDQVLLQ
jgi:uncharacterized surface protein with fasciclin (FAS1) repeats